MDRLSTLTFAGLALGLLACDTKAARPAGPPPSRTDGAKVAAPQAPTTDAFCDLHVPADKAAAFHWPTLAAGSTAPGPAPTWR